MLVDALADIERCPRVIIAHNVESLIWQRYFEAAVNPLKRWYIKQQWRKFERFERRAFASATRVVAVSEQDARLIRHRFGGRNVDVVDNGIDREYFETVQPDPDPKTILFLGSLDWRPNLDAVELLIDRIFPAVRAAEPTAQACAWWADGPLRRWSAGSPRSRASSCTPTCPTSGRSWPGAGSWSFPCGSAEGRG